MQSSIRCYDKAWTNTNFDLIPKLAQNGLSVLQWRTCHFCPLWHKVQCTPMLVEYDILILDWSVFHQLWYIFTWQVWMKLFSTNASTLWYATFGIVSISYVHFDGHAPTLNEIVVIHRQVMLNCQMSIVQFTNFVLIANQLKKRQGKPKVFGFM